ncbi:unnamed protein product, partial [Heterosigma akashiwo]
FTVSPRTTGQIKSASAPGKPSSLYYSPAKPAASIPAGLRPQTSSFLSENTQADAGPKRSEKLSNAIPLMGALGALAVLALISVRRRQRNRRGEYVEIDQDDQIPTVVL